MDSLLPTKNKNIEKVSGMSQSLGCPHLGSSRPLLLSLLEGLCKTTKPLKPQDPHISS